MKILLINNFYYNRGGDCTYLFSLQSLLRDKGHKTSVFSMHHPLNYESDYSKYFVSYINYDDEVKTKSMSSGLKVAKRTIYSKEAKAKINELIRDEKPDIAHIQNIHHHITPSIFSVLKEQGIPIIWTLHDYTIICPNTSFLSHGKICEKCKKRRYYWPLLTRCKKDSFAASLMAAAESTIHLIMRFNSYVDFIIVPSIFLKNKLIEYGFDEERIVHLNNFPCFNDVYEETNGNEDYFVYLGRLSEEKGVKTLIDASIDVFSANGFSAEKYSNYKLKIIGDGPLRKEMQSYVRSKSFENRIEFLGHKSHDDAIKILKGSKFLVIPSEWYENFPYSILESFAVGVPVIGSKLGGIPEIIKNWETGLLFEAGNAELLAGKIGFFIKHPDKAKAIGNNAKKYLSGNINSECHYAKLIEVYKKAVQKYR